MMLHVQSCNIMNFRLCGITTTLMSMVMLCDGLYFSTLISAQISWSIFTWFHISLLFLPSQCSYSGYSRLVHGHPSCKVQQTQSGIPRGKRWRCKIPFCNFLFYRQGHPIFYRSHTFLFFEIISIYLWNFRTNILLWIDFCLISNLLGPWYHKKYM